MNYGLEVFKGWLGRGLGAIVSPLGELEWSALYSFDLTGTVPLYPARAEIDVREAGEADIAALSTATPYHLPDLLRSRLEAGGTCLLAHVKGELAGFNWYVHGPAYDSGYRIELDPGHVYCLDAMTFPAYRGLAIHTELLSRLLIKAKGEGFTRAYTRASILNRASWKTHYRLGWRRGPSTFLLHPNPGSRRRPISWPRVYPLVHDPGHAAVPETAPEGTDQPAT